MMRSAQRHQGWPLLIRTGYSLLRGVGTPQAWVAAAAEGGFDLIALADWANLYGALGFLEAAEQRGLSGILGAEIPLAARPFDAIPRAARPLAARPLDAIPLAARPGRLLLFCQDLCGYRNLCTLLSRLGDGLPPPARSARAGRDSGAAAGGAPSTDPEDTLCGAGLRPPVASPGMLLEALAGGSEGLVLLSDVPRLVRDLRAICGPERLALLLPWPPPVRGVEEQSRLAARLGLGAAALPRATILEPGDAATLRLLAAIRKRRLVADGAGVAEIAGVVGVAGIAESAETAESAERDAPDNGDAAAPEAHPIPGAEALRAAGELCRPALARGRALLESCRLRSADLRPRTFVFPRVGGDEGPAALRQACREALGTRRLEDLPAARRRLQQELAVIEQLGFVDYFLATAEIARWARSRGIPLVGRGSGVSSLVAYLLGLTGVDPVAYGLSFARFLHPLRASDYPDLDLDIAWDRRDEVLVHALSAFGPERGAMVGTHQFYRPRGALRDAGRALGIDDATLSKAARAIPFMGMGAVDDAPAREGLARLAGEARGVVQRAAELAGTLLGRPRGVGLHPGGLVLSEMPISRMVPTERSANGMVITQFDMHGVERIGLIKIDLLGNRALATHEEAVRVLAGENKTVDLERVAHADPATAALLSEGRTMGCFQLESPAMRTLLRQVRATNLEDTIAALALVRPGPSSSGMKQAYIRRSRQIEAPRPLHSLVAHVLTRTYHLPLFEEDVMCLAAETGGLNHGEADMLRRAIGEAAREAGRQGAETPRLRELRQGFLAAAGRFGRQAAAEVIWNELVRFAAYSFCKAHAAGFGVLAYHSAYLKAHHPGAFFAAVLNHHQGMYPTRVHVEEARRHGLRPVPPCVQRGQAGWTWEPEGDRLRCGLARVRHLRSATLERMLAARRRQPFVDLADFTARVGPNALELESLVLAGCFDEAFGLPRGALVWRMHRLMRARRAVPAVREPWAGGHQTGLGLATAADAADGVPAGRWRDVSTEHRAVLERRFLGISLSAHPMALFGGRLPEVPGRRSLAAAAAAATGADGGLVAVAGIVSATRSFRSGGREPMLFFTLEDETGLLEGTLGGPLAGDRTRRPRVDDYLYAEGRVEGRYGARGLRATQARIVGRYE